MDCAGLEMAMALTIALGLLHVVVLALLGNNILWMIFGFVLYVLFRQFLFPVYIASLTHHLGYKFFGLLSGTGFFLSGISQLFMASLAELIQGDCHNLVFLRRYSTGETCDGGSWIQLHAFEFAILVALFFIPLFDRRVRIQEEESHKAILQERASWRTIFDGSDKSTRSGYGSVTGAAETARF